MTTRSREPRDTLLVVCRANLIRSPLAAGLLRASLKESGRTDLAVRSAGLQAEPGAPQPEHTVRIAEERGVDLSRHRPVGVTEDLVSGASLVLTMTETQRAAIMRMSPTATARTFTLPELARLITRREGADAHTWRDLARWAHVSRPLVAPAPDPEDVPDPVGRPLYHLQVIADDLVRLCGQVSAVVAPPGPS